ncbi:MAG: HEAT repeat domain-containing protein [Planctomycetaceae bacterium]|nr:HEAT repeat domain-containing protein [Planctomycetaceae bacterium]
MRKSTLITALCLLQVGLALPQSRAQAPNEAGLAEEAAPGLLANEPQTAEQFFDAALVMLRVSRPDLAQRYLAKLLELQPDDETLLRLREVHGTAMFLRLSRDEKLIPQSQQLLKRVQAAAANQVSNPAYFDGLISRLQDSPRERDAVIADLKHLGADAVPELLARLVDQSNFRNRDLLLETLVKFGPAAVDPLLGALDAPDLRTRAIAIDVLGWLGDESVVSHLWYPALAVDQPPEIQRSALRAIARIRYGDANLTSRLDPVGAAEEVYQGALQHFRDEYPWSPDLDGKLFVWSWDRAQNRLVKTATTPAAASMLMAERLARQAMLMAPDRDRNRALFLAAALAHARYRAGWGQPIPQGPGTAYDLALLSGASLTEMALGLAVEHGNPAAAESAVTALGALATRDTLRPRDGRPSPLIAALDFPNDRVQFAAAAAILELDPLEGFSRSQRVVEILARALRTEGGPRSIVIDPNTARAADTASMLNSLGFTTTVALTGQDGFREAVARGDVALTVLHPNTVRWELTQTIANLRADSRTAGVPIVIAAGEPARADMRRVLNRVPGSAFVSTDGGPMQWSSQLQPVLRDFGVPPLTPQQQAERALTAADWLRYIAQRSRSNVFDLSSAEDALSDVAAQPGFGIDAVIALGTIGRPSVQQRLVDLVLAPAIEVDTREAAARELAIHIRRFGRMLSDDAVTRLIDAWDQSSEPAMREALSSVIGVLRPTPAGILDRLSSFETPDVPLPSQP